MSVLLFTTWFHNFKDCVKMIKASDFEPPCSVGSERTKPVIAVLRSLPVWVQSQQEAQVQQRETIPSHLEGNRPVSPVNPWRTNQWNHMQLSQHTSELSGANQGGKILTQGIIMQYAGILNGWCLFVFMKRSLRCGCISENSDSCSWFWTKEIRVYAALFHV